MAKALLEELRGRTCTEAGGLTRGRRGSFGATRRSRNLRDRRPGSRLSRSPCGGLEATCCSPSWA